MHIKGERTCIVCKNKQSQNNMFRINYSNNIIEITNSKSAGRGAYICKSVDCVNKLIKSKALNKTFKCSINLIDYEKIQEQLIEQLKN